MALARVGRLACAEPPTTPVLERRAVLTHSRLSKDQPFLHALGGCRQLDCRVRDGAPS